MIYRLLSFRIISFTVVSLLVLMLQPASGDDLKCRKKIINELTSQSESAYTGVVATRNVVDRFECGKNSSYAMVAGSQLYNQILIVFDKRDDMEQMLYLAEHNNEILASAQNIEVLEGKVTIELTDVEMFALNEVIQGLCRFKKPISITSHNKAWVYFHDAVSKQRLCLSYGAILASQYLKLGEIKGKLTAHQHENK